VLTEKIVYNYYKHIGMSNYKSNTVLDNHGREVRNELHPWNSRQNVPVSEMALQEAYLASKNAL
jgi:hypothetical protein